MKAVEVELKVLIKEVCEEVQFDLLRMPDLAQGSRISKRCQWVSPKSQMALKIGAVNWDVRGFGAKDDHNWSCPILQ